MATCKYISLLVLLIIANAHAGKLRTPHRQIQELSSSNDPEIYTGPTSTEISENLINDMVDIFSAFKTTIVDIDPDSADAYATLVAINSTLANSRADLDGFDALLTTEAIELYEDLQNLIDTKFLELTVPDEPIDTNATSTGVTLVLSANSTFFDIAINTVDDVLDDVSAVLNSLSSTDISDDEAAILMITKATMDDIAEEISIIEAQYVNGWDEVNPYHIVREKFDTLNAQLTAMVAQINATPERGFADSETVPDYEWDTYNKVREKFNTLKDEVDEVTAMLAQINTAPETGFTDSETVPDE